MWEFDDISWLIEKVHSIDPFDGEEVNTSYDPDNAQHSLKPPSFLIIHITEPCHDAVRQYALIVHVSKFNREFSDVLNLLKHLTKWKRWRALVVIASMC